MPKPRALFVLDQSSFDRIYGPEMRDEIAELVDLIEIAPQPRDIRTTNPALLAEAEIIFSGWGGPKVDVAFLDAAPNLKAFFYGAGATGGTIAPEAFARGLVVTSAAHANAVPVAEYTIGAICLALKQVFRFQRKIYATGVFGGTGNSNILAGAYGTTVGLVSLGAIGRIVVPRLQAALPDVRIVAYDPFVTPEEAAEMSVELVGLDAVFAQSEVVSLHTPWLPETERMIRGEHFAAMKPGATFLNTARGAVVAENEMIAVLTERPDLTVLLDVTHPEPPVPGSPLYTLPNVFLTPHVAGSIDTECRRLGRYMVEELRLYLLERTLLYQIRPETAVHTSHRV